MSNERGSNRGRGKVEYHRGNIRGAEREVSEVAKYGNEGFETYNNLLCC